MPKRKRVRYGVKTTFIVSAAKLLNKMKQTNIPEEKFLLYHNIQQKKNAQVESSISVRSLNNPKILIYLVLISNGILPVVPLGYVSVILVVTVVLMQLTLTVGIDSTLRNRPEHIVLVHSIVQSLTV